MIFSVIENYLSFMFIFDFFSINLKAHNNASTGSIYF
jgi:hypothetical protein